MARGRWKKSEDQLAAEAHAVLVKKKRATVSVERKDLIASLADSTTYQAFLKLCAEHDDSNDMEEFRKGLRLVLQALGTAKVASLTSVSRVTLYRMLAKGGNPRLTSLISLLKALGLHFWIVDSHFIQRGRKVTRPKDQKYLKA